MLLVLAMLLFQVISILDRQFDCFLEVIYFIILICKIKRLGHCPLIISLQPWLPILLSSTYLQSYLN